jgi:hypothetical protein
MPPWESPAATLLYPQPGYVSESKEKAFTKDYPQYPRASPIQTSSTSFTSLTVGRRGWRLGLPQSSDEFVKMNVQSSTCVYRHVHAPNGLIISIVPSTVEKHTCQDFGDVYTPLYTAVHRADVNFQSPMAADVHACTAYR